MSTKSTIERTSTTWNLVSGCDKVSDGCETFYAGRTAIRRQAMHNRRFSQGFSLTLHLDLVDLPKSWNNPRLVFVNSMGDMFHEDIPLKFLKQVFATMIATPQHTYQILTKTSGRLGSLAPHLPWPRNVWMGVSVENDKFTNRIDDLRTIPSTVRFISAEPLQGPLKNLNLEGITWLIAGRESGRTPVTCRQTGCVPCPSISSTGYSFLVPTMGRRPHGKTGRTLDGVITTSIHVH